MSATLDNFKKAFPQQGGMAQHQRVREITADDFIGKVQAEAIVGRIKGSLGTYIMGLPLTGRVTPFQANVVRMVFELNANRMVPYGIYRITVKHYNAGGYVGTTYVSLVAPAFVTSQALFSSMRLENVTSLAARSETASVALTVRGHAQRLSQLSESTLGNVVVGPRVLGTQYPVNVLSNVSSTMAMPRYREASFWRERCDFPYVVNPVGTFVTVPMLSGIGAMHSRLKGSMRIGSVSPSGQNIQVDVTVEYEDGYIATVGSLYFAEVGGAGGFGTHAVDILLDDNEGPSDHYGVIAVSFTHIGTTTVTMLFAGYVEFESGEQSGERKASLIGVVEGVRPETVVSVSGLLLMSVTPLQATGQLARVGTAGAAVECDWDQVVTDLDDRPRVFAEEVIHL
jgi:hypothetical protein